MNATTLLGAGCVAGAYALWVTLAVSRRLTVDGRWLLALALFFDLFAFAATLVLPGLPPVALLVAASGAVLVAAFLAAPASASGAFATPSLLACGALVLLAVASLAWSGNPEYGQHKLAIFLARGVVPGVVAAAALRSSSSDSWSPILLVGLAFVLTVLTWGGATSGYAGRLALPEGNPIWTGRLAWFAVGIAVWERRAPLPLRVATILGGAVVGLLSGSRGPLLAFLVANAVVWLWIRRSGAPRARRRVAAVAIASLIVVGAIGAELDRTGFDDQARAAEARLRVLADTDELVQDVNVRSRVASQARAVRMAADRPWLGVGLGGFATGGRDYPHNLLLELAAEVGAAGVALWLLTLALMLRQARPSPVLACLLVMAVLHTFASGDLGANSEWVLLGLAGSSWRARTPEAEEPA